MKWFNTKNNSIVELNKKIQVLENKEKYLISLQQIILALVVELNLEQLTQKVVDLTVKQFDYTSAVLFLIPDNENYIYSHTVSNIAIVNKAVKFFGKSFRDHRADLSTDNSLIVKTVREQRNFKGGNLSEFVSPTLSENLANMTQGLLNIHCTISIPLTFAQTKLGVIMFNSRNDDFDDEEVFALKSFVDEIAIAIYNAKLFDQVNNQVIVLTKKNEELSSLYNLTAKVSSTLDRKQVSQDAVDSLPQNKLMIGAIISMFNKAREYIAPLAASHTQLSYGIEKLIGDLTQYGLHLSDPMATENLVMRSFLTGKIIYEKDLTNFLVPAISKKFVKPISDLLKIKGVAVYPLIIRNQVLGTLSFFIQEKEVDQLDDGDKQLLQTYTNQIAIALENARLFQESEEIRSELQSTIKQLEAARKHERDMIDIMGHELRTPMSILRNSLLIMDTQMKINPPDLLEKIHKYIEIGVDAARREVSLIETLLSATKTDGKGFQLILEKIDINDLINNAMVAFKRQAETKGLTLTYEKSETPVIIYSDRTRVQEIVDNFINNAVKYTIEGSVTVKVYEEEGFGYFTVEDTGIGIAEEDLKRLGTKFFRARQNLEEEVEQNATAQKLEIIRPGGTGLGLYVTFNLIKLLGGKLILKSKVKEGSTFGAGFTKYTGQTPAQLEKKIDQFEQSA